MLGLTPAGRAGGRAAARGGRARRGGAARARHRQPARAGAVRARGAVGAAARAQADPDLRHLARAAAADDDGQDPAARDRAPRRASTRRRATRDARARPADERAWLADAGARRTRSRRSRRASDRPSVRPDANLELDLGLDSMERVELLTVLEQRQGTRVPPEVRATIFTRAAARGRRRGARRPSADAGRRRAGRATLPWDTLLADAARSGARRRPLAIEDRSAPSRCSSRSRSSRSSRASLLGLPRRGPRSTCRPTARSSSARTTRRILDGFFLAAALPFRTFRQLFFVGAAEYFETPFMRWLARAINIVPVDPDANLVNAMRAGAAGLRSKQGADAVSRRRAIDRRRAEEVPQGRGDPRRRISDAPIVPVALDGLFELWPRGRSFNWRGLLPWRVAGHGRVRRADRCRPGDYAAGTARSAARCARDVRPHAVATRDDPSPAIRAR